MVKIETEQNIEILRQVAYLLWRENEALHERLRKLTAEKLKLQGADAQVLQLEIDQLQELLARREREIFWRLVGKASAASLRDGLGTGGAQWPWPAGAETTADRRGRP